MEPIGEKIAARIEEASKRENLGGSSLLRAKRRLARELGQNRIIKNSSLWAYYQRLVRAGKVAKNPDIKSLLKVNPVRTQSGVAPVAVLTKPHPCPGECLYCPQQEGIPKSYLTQEPAVDRAISHQYDPYRQTEARIRALEKTGHSTDKIDLIIIGGTFLAYPHNYQKWFIKRCFDACNQTNAQDLAQAKKLNEKAPHRLIGISVETRPDTINEKEIQRLRRLGVTKIELGVQSLSNRILKRCRRGHTVANTIRATKLLKNTGFKVCYHMMPNLPGANPQSDVKMFKTLFKNAKYQPDMLKIYPCAVIKSAPLYQDWLRGEYKPYSDPVLTELIIKIKISLPEYVRINRLIRDIPANKIEAGTKKSNLRQEIKKIMERRGLKCHCIRCREIKQRKPQSDLQLKMSRYRASGGWEYFLQYTDSNDQLYGILRLRFPSRHDRAKTPFPELKNVAIIRELHIYGKALPIGKSDSDSPQHSRLGRKLLAEAERITKEAKIPTLAVISGVGAREYYRQRGYQLRGEYLVKRMSSS